MTSRRSRVTVRRYTSAAEADKDDLSFWQQLSPAGLSFAEAWSDRIRGPFGEIQVDFIGREAFIRNKRATGRTKDLADIEGLE